MREPTPPPVAEADPAQLPDLIPPAQTSADTSPSEAVVAESTAGPTADEANTAKQRQEQDRKERAEFRRRAAELLEKLSSTYPQVFCAREVRRIRPLKLGIHKDLIPQVREWGYPIPCLKLALARYTGTMRYQMALLKEKARIDLEGHESGDISDEHRAKAEVEVARLRQLREQRRKPKSEEAAAQPAANAENKPSSTTQPSTETQVEEATKPRKERRRRPTRGDQNESKPRERNTTRSDKPTSTRPRPQKPTEGQRRRPAASSRKPSVAARHAPDETTGTGKLLDLIDAETLAALGIRR